MKRTHFKILATVLVAIMLLATVFTIISFAGENYAEITFVENSSSYKKAILKGSELELPDPNENDSVGGVIYGWFDKEGNLYEPGQKIRPTEDLTLYRAEGDEFALSASLPIYCQKGYTYVKLKSSISLDSPITLPNNKILFIDLNGNNISLTTEASYDSETGEEIPVGAFVGQNSGVIFANSSATKSTISHTAGGNVDFLVNSLVSVSPDASAKNLTFVVKENVAIDTNMNLLSVQTDISENPGALNLSIHGEVDCGRLLRSNGLENANVKIYEGAKVSASSEYMFEDIIPDTNNVVTLNIYGGDITLNVGFIKNAVRMTPLIYGGRFSKDVSELFINSNFKFEKDSSGFFVFKGCAHQGPLSQNVVSCDEDCDKLHDHCTCTIAHQHCNENCTITDPSHVHCECKLDHTHCQCLSLTNHTDHFHCDTPRKLTHRCIYCNQLYEVEYPNGVGHSFRMELVQPPINTPEETQAARYKTYCTRGDYERLEYAFPDPSSVYVTVKYMDGEEEKTVRIPSLDIYSFDETLKTKIISFSVDSVYTLDEDGEKKQISPESIFFVEVPLGTTDLYGEMMNANNTPTKVGVFVNDYYLKEVALPISIVNVNDYAFYNMNSIEKITGVEYITGNIGTEAFMQSAKTKLSFDHLELNAKKIGSSAFRNIIIKNTLTIGKNVEQISNYAFALDPEITVDPKDRIKEIFIEGNEIYNGVKLGVAKTNMGGYHQFSDMPIVYIGHDYIKTTIPSTCISYGHDLNKCSRCFAEYQDNFVMHFSDHNYIEHVVPSTCQQYGFDGYMCTVCELKVKKEVGGDLPIDKNNHMYAAGVVKYPIKSGTYFCTDPYYTLRLCECGKIEPMTESFATFTFPGDESQTKWEIFLLENGEFLIYKNGQRITSKSTASLTTLDGAFKTLTHGGYTCTLTKVSGSGKEGDTLSGTYTARFGSTYSFTVEISIGSRLNAFIPASNAKHNYKETVLVEPTCVEGIVKRVCLDCRYEPPVEAVSPVLQHTREQIIMQSATCSVFESGIYKCTLCGDEKPYEIRDKYNDKVHAKKINDQGVVVAEPSSEHAGIRRFQCKDCGADIFEEIPKVDNSFSFTIPLLNITINTTKRTFTITLIAIFAAIPLIAGVLLTFIFTFTKKKSKSAGYKFRFNTLKKGNATSNKSVSEQLHDMNLVDELPPDVEFDENGIRDDEAAWTAYVDALNNDYTRTIEMNLQKEIEEDSSVDEVKPDNANAWEAYVEAINRDYEQTMEFTINNQAEDKSLAELMADTVVDVSLSGTPTDQGEGIEENETFDLGAPSDDEAFDLGESSDDETFSL